MAWTKLEKKHVHRRLSAAEIKTIQTVQIDEGEGLATDQGMAIQLGSEAVGIGASLEDPLQAAIDETVAEIRADIASSRINNLNDDATTLPDGLFGTALSIITFKLYTRLGGELVDFGDTRQTLFDTAQETLRRVRSGEQAIPEATGTAYQGEGWKFSSDTKIDLI